MQHEPRIIPVSMTGAERGQFIRKAKADRLAFEAAELLSLGKTSEAAKLADEGMTLAGREQLATWLHHYATTRFKVAGNTVDGFIGAIQPGSVAV